MRRAFGRGVAGAVSAVALLAMAGEAGAQERFNPRVGLATTGPYYRFSTALRVNPIGLFVDFRGGWRQRLFNDPGRSVLLRNTYVALAGTVVTSPAFVRPGIALEVQPLAILNLQAVWEPVVQWFGTFGNVQSFNDVTSNYSDAVLSRNRNVPGAVQTARGWQFTAQATLQARIGQTLALRDTFRAVYQKYDPATLTSGRTGLFYDPFYDVIAPTDGWTLVNDVDVIAQLTDLGTNLGLRFSSVMPQLGSFANDSTTTTTHRLGPIVTYTFRERRHGAVNAPTLYALAQWWLQHPFRTGGDNEGAVSRALPMIIVGFSMRGDW